MKFVYSCGGPWGCGRKVTSDQVDTVIETPGPKGGAVIVTPGVFCVHEEPNGEKSWWEMYRSEVGGQG